MSETLELVQALGSKICHDLAGSIGTIDNCLSLLDSANEEVGDKAKKLAIAESKKLVKTIKFIRSTYGLADRGAKTALNDMESILTNYFEDSAIKLKTHISDEGADIEAYLAKVAFCLISIAAESVGNEGSIDLHINLDQPNLFKIHCNGRDFQAKPESHAVLNGDDNIPLSIKNCREHYASNICKEYGYKLSIDKSAGFTQYLVTKK